MQALDSKGASKHALLCRGASCCCENSRHLPVLGSSTRLLESVKAWSRHVNSHGFSHKMIRNKPAHAAQTIPIEWLGTSLHLMISLFDKHNWPSKRNVRNCWWCLTHVSMRPYFAYWRIWSDFTVLNLVKKTFSQSHQSAYTSSHLLGIDSMHVIPMWPTVSWPKGIEWWVYYSLIDRPKNIEDWKIWHIFFLSSNFCGPWMLPCNYLCLCCQ